MIKNAATLLLGYLFCYQDDSAIGEWAKHDIGLLKQYSIMEGMENGYFNPHNHTTRDQSSKMIYELLATLSFYVH